MISGLFVAASGAAGNSDEPRNVMMPKARNLRVIVIGGASQFFHGQKRGDDFLVIERLMDAFEFLVRPQSFIALG